MKVSVVIVVTTSDSGKTNEAVAMCDIPTWSNTRGYGTDINMAIMDLIHEIEVNEGKQYP